MGLVRVSTQAAVAVAVLQAPPFGVSQLLGTLEVALTCDGKELSFVVTRVVAEQRYNVGALCAYCHREATTTLHKAHIPMSGCATHDDNGESAGGRQMNRLMCTVVTASPVQTRPSHITPEKVITAVRDMTGTGPRGRAAAPP